MASSSVLLKRIDAVLVDPSFFTGSVVAEDALQAAKLLKQWCIREENNEVVIGSPMNFSVIFKEFLYFLVGDVLSTEKRYGSSISLFGHQVFSYHSGRLSWNCHRNFGPGNFGPGDQNFPSTWSGRTDFFGKNGPPLENWSE